MRHQAMFLTSAAVAAAGWGASPAIAGPCERKACSKTMMVGETPTIWRSPHTLSEGSGIIVLDVYDRKGRVLDAGRAHGDCEYRWTTSDMFIRLRVCDDVVNVRAVSVKGRHQIRLTYRVLPEERIG